MSQTKLNGWTEFVTFLNKAIPYLFVLGIATVLFFAGLNTSTPWETTMKGISIIIAIAIIVIGFFLSISSEDMSGFLCALGFLGGWAFAYFAGYSLTEPAQYASALLCTIASLVLLLMGRMIVKE